MKAPPKILLTGGAGLIGNAALHRLNQLGHTDIIVVDKLGSDPHKWRNLSRCQFADYIEYSDFYRENQEYAGRTLKDVTVVIHLGANSSTTETDVAHLMKDNLGFSQFLAAWCANNDARFVYASSCATYGAASTMDDGVDIDTLRPLNPYGYSKQLFDQWMTRNGLLKQGGAAGLKYSNVFGWPERHKGEMRSVVCRAYDSLKSGKPIELFESARKDIATGDIRRDFLSVEDAAAITVWAALDGAGSKASGLFNVGSGVATSFVDLATYVSNAYTTVCGKPYVTPEGFRDWEPPYIRYVPMPEHLQGRYQYHTLAPINKLRAAGYTAEITLIQTAVERYVGQMAKEDTL